MLIIDNFFKSNYTDSKKYNNNIKKTKKFFNAFLIDLKNYKIPLLESYKKDYEYDFSKTMVKKFSKYKNIIVIGMGGSILGTKTIYSFLGKKIRKKVFFFDNLDFNLNLNYKYTGKHTDYDGAKNTRQKSTDIVNLSFSKKLFGYGFSLSISNLLNERYERPATYSQDGRQFRLGFKRNY